MFWIRTVNISLVIKADSQPAAAKYATEVRLAAEIAKKLSKALAHSRPGMGDEASSDMICLLGALFFSFQSRLSAPPVRFVAFSFTSLKMQFRLFIVQSCNPVPEANGYPAHISLWMIKAFRSHLTLATGSRSSALPP
jgi:hypothetical protein